MEVLIAEDENVGLIQRAARCDGAHDQPTLASRRIIVNGVAFDCCRLHLRRIIEMALTCHATFVIEPTVDDIVFVAHARGCRAA